DAEASSDTAAAAAYKTPGGASPAQRLAASPGWPRRRAGTPALSQAWQRGPPDPPCALHGKSRGAAGGSPPAGLSNERSRIPASQSANPDVDAGRPARP